MFSIHIYIFTDFYFRYNKLAIKVAGLQEIHVNGIENIDFSDTVKKHTDYCLNMKQILESINLLGAANPENVYMESDDGLGDERPCTPPPSLQADSDDDSEVFDESLDEATHGC